MNQEEKIKFVFICSNDSEWVQGKPNIPICFKKWNIDTVKKDIQEFDIGIIPNISEIILDNKLDNNIKLGKYNTDFKIRFKNKSNIGRSLSIISIRNPSSSRYDSM